MWVAPAIMHLDSAAAMASCPGVQTVYTFANASGLAGVDCGTNVCSGEPSTTGAVSLGAMTGMASHTTLTVTGSVAVAVQPPSNPPNRDMILVLLDGVIIDCIDGINSSNSIALNTVVSDHSSCTGTLSLLGCVTNTATETWSYSGITVTLS